MAFSFLQSPGGDMDGFFFYLTSATNYHAHATSAALAKLLVITILRVQECTI